MTPTPEQPREITEELIEDLAFNAVSRAAAEQDRFLSLRDRRRIADAVVDAVTPVIRRQELEEIRSEIAEKIELRRRAALETARDSAEDNRQQVYSAGQATAYEELAERLDRYFDDRSGE